MGKYLLIALVLVGCYHDRPPGPPMTPDYEWGGKPQAGWYFSSTLNYPDKIAIQMIGPFSSKKGCEQNLAYSQEAIRQSIAHGAELVAVDGTECVNPMEKNPLPPKWRPK